MDIWQRNPKPQWHTRDRSVSMTSVRAPDARGIDTGLKDIYSDSTRRTGLITSSIPNRQLQHQKSLPDSCNTHYLTENCSVNIWQEHCSLDTKQDNCSTDAWQKSVALVPDKKKTAAVLIPDTKLQHRCQTDNCSMDAWQKTAALVPDKKRLQH